MQSLPRCPFLRRTGWREAVRRGLFARRRALTAVGASTYGVALTSFERSTRLRRHQRPVPVGCTQPRPDAAIRRMRPALSAHRAAGGLWTVTACCAVAPLCLKMHRSWKTIAGIVSPTPEKGCNAGAECGATALQAGGRSLASRGSV